MMSIRILFILILMAGFNTGCMGKMQKVVDNGYTKDADSVKLILGADQIDEYLRIIKGHKIAVVANQTSVINGQHLVDKLIAEGVAITRVFAPEHGFRGEAGPGDLVNSGKDAKTGLNVVSLYGTHKKPTAADMKDVDYIIFDIQDVGARFYTYISTLHYIMEACAEFKVKLIILDRPNPNGFYIDGPVLDTAFRSFVGIAPIPVVHGLTFGEYAMMANGERWLAGGVKCDITVVKMKNYTHGNLYQLPVRPSPNLPNMTSIYLYPTLCFFEGTKVSVGRGTSRPFEIAGFPGYKKGSIKDTPKELAGIIKDPPYENQECNFEDYGKKSESVLNEKKLMIEWIIEMYKAYPDKDKFFSKFFDTLSGTDKFRKQIIAGQNAEEIRKSWQPELERYRKMRSKYLLYED